MPRCTSVIADPFKMPHPHRVAADDISKPSRFACRGKPLHDSTSQGDNGGWHQLLEPEGARQPAVPGITSEELVSTFSADGDGHLGAGGFRQSLRCNEGLVSYRLVEGRKDLRGSDTGVSMGQHEFMVVGSDRTRN